MTFSQVSLPLIKKVYPSLIANKLVGVQPLSAPSGLVHYLNRYSDSMMKNFEVNRPIVDENGLPDDLLYNINGFPSYKTKNYNAKILHLLNPDKSLHKKVYQISYSVMYYDLQLCMNDLNACIEKKNLKELDKGNLNCLFNYLDENNFEINRVRINVAYDKEYEKQCIYMESNVTLFNEEDQEYFENLYEVIYPTNVPNLIKSTERVFDPYGFKEFVKKWPHNCHMCLYDSNVSLDKDWMEGEKCYSKI